MTRSFGPRLLAGLLALAPAALAQEQRIGEVVLTDPEKKVLGKRLGREPRELRVTSDVYTEMEIETLQGAFAEVSFEQGGYLALDPETRVSITQRERTARSEDCELRRGKGPRPEVSMSEGRMLVAILPRSSWTFDVVAGPADVLICGTLIGVHVQGDVAIVSVFEGLAEVGSGEDVVVVGAGLRTVVRRGAAPTPPAPIDPSDWTLSPAAGDVFFDGDGNLPSILEVPDRSVIRGRPEN